MADAHIRALTARHPIKPTSRRCQSAWQPNPGRPSTYRSGKSVQTTGTTSANRFQGEIHWQFRNEPGDNGEPLKVAYLFMQKRTGKPVEGIPYVPSKDVETARQLLAKVPFEEIAGFLDFALQEAKSTKFDVQTLGGLRQYLEPYLANRERLEASRKAEAARRTRDQEEADLYDYDHFRRQQADTLFARLPADEQAAIEALARSSGGDRPLSGPMAATLSKVAKLRLTAERHPDQVLTFEQWRLEKRRAA